MPQQLAQLLIAQLAQRDSRLLAPSGEYRDHALLPSGPGSSGEHEPEFILHVLGDSPADLRLPLFAVDLEDPPRHVRLRFLETSAVRS